MAQERDLLAESVLPHYWHLAPIGGAHDAAAQAAGSPYDPSSTFPAPLKTLHPAWTTDDILNVIDVYRANLSDGIYRAEWTGIFRDVYSNAPEEKRDVVMHRYFSDVENALKVRSLIADWIEHTGLWKG